jgi:hypothetical protein
VKGWPLLRATLLVHNQLGLPWLPMVLVDLQG